jgi:hypothetical protein
VSGFFGCFLGDAVLNCFLVKDHGSQGRTDR